jgi:hypothetical protein
LKHGAILIAVTHLHSSSLLVIDVLISSNSTQATRFFVGVMVESTERESELSESGLLVNSEVRAISHII